MSSCRLTPFVLGDGDRILGDGPDEVSPFSIDDCRSGSDHGAALQRVCCIGGLQFDSLSKSTKYLAKDLAPEILAVFGVNVRNDLDGVHPPSICRLCRLVLSPFSTAESQKRDYTRTGGGCGPLQIWTPHTDGCYYEHAHILYYLAHILVFPSLFGCVLELGVLELRQPAVQHLGKEDQTLR